MLGKITSNRKKTIVKVICLVLLLILTLPTAMGTVSRAEEKSVTVIFTDIDGIWAEESIKTLASKGIIRGVETDKFAPATGVKRAEFTAMVARALDLTLEFPLEPTFNDVCPGKWFYGYLEAAAKVGLVYGSGELSGNNFYPDRVLERQEMVVMLVRALKNTDGMENLPVIQIAEKLDLFVDADEISAWAREDVAIAVAKGIIKGQPDDMGFTFAPFNNASRAEAASVVWCLLNYLNAQNVADPAVEPTDEEAVILAQEEIIVASNHFALELYASLGNDGGNIFFSPHSVFTALSMLYEGARGQTAAEMRAVLQFSAEDAVRRSAMSAIHSQLNPKDARYSLHTANALWLQRDFQILLGYVETVEKYYSGKVSNVDFVKETEKARQTINSWVEGQTNDKIKDLFAPGSLSQLTRLVLTNAIYFKGDWEKQFNKEDTMDEYFRISPQERVKIPMMRHLGNDARFNYMETEEIQVLEMLYAGEELSMLVLLPKDENMETLAETLTVENLTKWRSELREQRVDVYLPAFTLNSKYSLNQILKGMGMPLAFTPPAASADTGADFSGINGKKDLYVHSVVHQAFIAVDEEGTEAAAATGITIGVTSVGPAVPVFRADHPFVFMILERKTGNILFLGRMVNPS